MRGWHRLTPRDGRRRGDLADARAIVSRVEVLGTSALLGCGHDQPGLNQSFRAAAVPPAARSVVHRSPIGGGAFASLGRTNGSIFAQENGRAADFNRGWRFADRTGSLMVVPGFVFGSLMMPGFPWCLGVGAPKLLRTTSRLVVAFRRRRKRACGPWRYAPALNYGRGITALKATAMSPPPSAASSPVGSSMRPILVYL